MKTSLYDRQVKSGAKMISFCGWEMPLQYIGIVQEHMTVRQKVGVFDVSHMGRILVEGPEAEKFLDYLSTNHIAGKNDLTATYTVWCNDKGGCIDDVIVYKKDPSHYFVIVNACNRDKNLMHLRSEGRKFDVKIMPLFSDGILAVQGPQAPQLVEKIFVASSTLQHMHFIPIQYMHEEIILSATGYTGEKGFEIYGPSIVIANLWEQLLALGIQPVGLGARDTLRLEKGYALYGHELAEDIPASATVSSWTIKWDKPTFLGKKALEEWKNSSKKQKEYGLLLLDKGVAREGYPVFKEGKLIGKITSGTFSPSLQKSIAIALLEDKIKQEEIVEVQIRQNLVKANVVELPFY